MKPYLLPILHAGRLIGKFDAAWWRLVGWTWKRLAAAHTRHAMGARRNLGGIVHNPHCYGGPKPHPMKPRPMDPLGILLADAARLAGQDVDRSYMSAGSRS